MATILVVDDLAVDRRLVSEFLKEDPSLVVTTACDGADALAKMDQAPFDLVLTDLMMPELDGLQLVAAVRSRYPLVPVILMTSQGNEEIAVQALQQGAASYVPKRRLAHDLVHTVHRVLGVSSRQRGHTRLMGCLMRSESTFTLRNDCTLFDPLIAYLQESVAHLGLCSDADATRIGVALAEALANALYHGNLEVGSRLRIEDDLAYWSLVSERCNQEPYRDRQIQVHVSLSREEAQFEVHDEGIGFDPRTLPDPTDPSNLEKATGRGILLMRTFMDEITYNETGNIVRLVKRYRPA